MSDLSLIELFKKYGNAHTGEGTDKNLTHCYGRFYENLFSSIRREVRNLLEIGACAGASCLVWAEYFPQARIDGIDRTLEYLAFGKEHERIRYHQLDGTLKSTPCALNHTMYDIVIDDGSHHPPHQLESLGIFAPFIRPGGFYVIEDIQTGEEIKQPLFQIAQEHGLMMGWHDMRRINSRYDDVCAVFTRPRIKSRLIDYPY